MGRGRSRELQKLNTSVWRRWTAAGLTLLACISYAGLYALVPVYRQQLEQRINELPIFNRIVLNIYQPFLTVFILISIALLILYHLKAKQRGSGSRLLLLLIVVNLIVAVILLGLTVAELI